MGKGNEELHLGIKKPDLVNSVRFGSESHTPKQKKSVKEMMMPTP
jgi:hypothetical protein